MEATASSYIMEGHSANNSYEFHYIVRQGPHRSAFTRERGWASPPAAGYVSHGLRTAEDDQWSLSDSVV